MGGCGPAPAQHRLPSKDPRWPRRAAACAPFRCRRVSGQTDEVGRPDPGPNSLSRAGPRGPKLRANASILQLDEPLVEWLHPGVCPRGAGWARVKVEDAVEPGYLTPTWPFTDSIGFF